MINVDANKQCCNGNYSKKEFKFITFPCFLETSCKNKKMNGKVDRENNHKSRNNKVYAHTVVISYTEVAVGKTAGTCSAEGMQYSIKPVHTCKAQAKCHYNCKCTVYAVKQF